MTPTADLHPVHLGKYFRITAHGLDVTGHPKFSDFEALGETLRTLDRSLQFAIGDFFCQVEERYKEQASQILDHTGWSEATLRAYRWTAQQVKPENRRMDVLTYSHHQAVGALAPREQRQWLDRAARGDDGTPWSVNKMKREMRVAGDDPETAWWVLVRATSAHHQQEIIDTLGRQGYECRPIQRHTPTGAWGTGTDTVPVGDPVPDTPKSNVVDIKEGRAAAAAV